MNDLFNVVTVPLKKLAQLLFSLQIGNTNLGSIIVVGLVFVVLISVIMHGGGSILTGAFRLGEKVKNRQNTDKD